MMGKRGWTKNEGLVERGYRRRDAFIAFIERSSLSMSEIGEWIGYSRQYIQWLTKNPMGFETARRLEQELGLAEWELEGEKMKE